MPVITVHALGLTHKNYRPKVTAHVLGIAHEYEAGITEHRLAVSHRLSPRLNEDVRVTDLVINGTANGQGGPELGEIVLQQTHQDSIPGVTVLRALGNELGEGTLSIVKNELYARVGWRPSGGMKSSPLYPKLSGPIELTTEAGSEYGVLVIDVEVTDLVTGEYRISVDVGVDTFKVITKYQSVDGLVDYLCVYLSNISVLDMLDAVEVYIGKQPDSGSTLSIGVDLAGVGGEAALDPSGVTFSSPTKSSRLMVGDVPPSTSVALWIKRVLPLNSHTTWVKDLARLIIRAVK